MRPCKKLTILCQVHWKKIPPRKTTPHQVFGDLGSKWPPDEDSVRCRAGTSWHFALFAENQYGGQVPGLVSPTFFLWEIIQKFFFPAWDFDILATQKSHFRVKGGPKGALGAFWLISELKWLFWPNCIKNHVFKFF